MEEKSQVVSQEAYKDALKAVQLWSDDHGRMLIRGLNSLLDCNWITTMPEPQLVSDNEADKTEVKRDSLTE